MKRFKYLLFLISLILHSSCGFKVSSIGNHSDSGNFISGIISPFSGLITENNSSMSIISSASAALCADPVYAKLFAIESDGTIDENNPLTTQLIGSDARYSFNVNSLGISKNSTNVQLLIKAEGCNGDTYKRPVTNFNNQQNVDAKSTVIAEVVNANSLITKTLNQASRVDIENLINSVSGTSTTAVLNSLTSEANNSTKFTEIFGASPSIILDASPEVKLVAPASSINELAVSNFSILAFHVDPGYSFAYAWKLDGVVKSTNASWSYIPSANESGSHNIVLYVGKNNGLGSIDLSKPYYTKSATIIVNNNMLPTPPDLSLNASTPSPRNTNAASIDLSTGVSLANCSTFSHLAITDTPNTPGILQFNIDCHTSGTQTENISFSTGDGAKSIYIWAIDDEGNISAPKTTSLVLDSLPPSVSLNLGTINLRGGTTQNLSLSATDAGVGLNTLTLYFSTDNGVTYSLVSNLTTSATSYNWAVPAIDTAYGVLKLVATDLTSSTTTLYSSTFTIDSTAPSAPTISRSSSANSNSTTVAINATCSADYNKVFYSQSNSTPSLTDSAWENCASTKNFTVSTGDGVKIIYSFSRDAIGNISSSSNITMTLDIITPSAPEAGLSSAAISSSSAVSITVTDCLDRPYVLVSESILSPTANDSNWQSCSTSTGAIGHTLLGPVLQGTHNLYVYAKDAVGNISPSINTSMIYDTTNPSLNLASILDTLYKGGDVVSLSFSAADINGLNSYRLEYAADGTNYSLVTNLASIATTYNWTVPASNSTVAKIRLVAQDNATSANTSTVYSTSFTVDSTAPTAPTLTRTSPAFSNANNVSMTVGSCTDTAYILITESSSQPVAGAPGWQFCSTAVGNISGTVSGEGTHTLYAWGKDLAGNITASANNITMTLDTTAPVIAVTTPNSMQGNVNSGSATWSLTEINVGASTFSAVEIYNGSSWSSVGSVAAVTGINTNQSYSLSNFTVPAVDVSAAKIRVTFTDPAGNSTTTQSGVFTIDTAAPVLSAVLINNGAVYAGTSLVNVSVNLSDNFSGSNLSIKIASANTGTDDCQSEYVNSNWMVWTSSTQNFAFTISPVDGQKKICIWAKDALGNVTVMSPTAGTLGVNYNTILYQTGNPPQITSITVSNTSNGTSAYALSDPVTINWSASDAEGLNNNPIALSYSTDNSTWKDVFTAQDSSVASNVTWMGGASGNPTSASGTYTSFNAPSAGYFIFKIVAKDIAGNISIPAQSQPQNTNQWSVFAGTTDRGNGGSGSTAALYSGGGGTGLTFAINPKTNDMYALDDGVGIRKLDIQSGKVSTFITHGTSNLPVSGVLSSSSRVNANSNDRMIIDNNGILYLMVSASTTTSATIYKINLSNNNVDFYFGGGTDNSTSATASTAYVSAGIMDVDANGNLYFMSDCTPTAPTQFTAKKLMIVGENSDGTPGSISHLAGNCAFGSITSGQIATGQPISFSGSSYPQLSSVAAVNPNLVYFSAYGNNNFKIINGVAYSVTIGSTSRAGQVTYNHYNNKMYRSVADKSVSYFTPLSAASAGGETLTTLVTSTGTGGCLNDGVDATSACVVSDSGFAFDSNGVAYFIDGLVSNAPNGYRIRYVDSLNKVRTMFGSMPFYGDGLNKGLIRGKIGGIYYKKASEPNQTAFPVGLYLVSPSMVFGRINESDSVYHTLYGNQQGDGYNAPTGTTVSPSVSMGPIYSGGNGMVLTMDSNGLPWTKTNSQIIQIDANNKVVKKMNGASIWDRVSSSTDPSTLTASPYGGYQNLTLKNNGAFFIGGYTTSYDATPQIRYFDFASLVSPIIMGATYLHSQNSAMSADITTPGGVESAPLSYLCTNTAACSIQYISSQDRLYFKSIGTDKYLRYISNPTNTATSTLTTMPLQFVSTSVINFIFSEDLSQIFYITSSGLYCMDISSGKSWCNNTTNLYPYSATMGSFTFGPNQMTWKDSSTLLISNYNGKILQYILSP